METEREITKYDLLLKKILNVINFYRVIGIKKLWNYFQFLINLKQETVFDKTLMSMDTITQYYRPDTYIYF